jgi:hypothetical protein
MGIELLHKNTGVAKNVYVVMGYLDSLCNTLG